MIFSDKASNVTGARELEVSDARKEADRLRRTVRLLLFGRLAGSLLGRGPHQGAKRANAKGWPLGVWLKLREEDMHLQTPDTIVPPPQSPLPPIIDPDDATPLPGEVPLPEEPRPM